MKYTYKKTDFTSGFADTQFNSELVAEFGSNLRALNDNLDRVIIRFNIALTSGEESTLDGLVASHVPIIPTTLEDKIEELLSTNDYKKTKEEAQDLISDFSSLNDREKEVASIYCLVDGSIIRSYWESQGYSSNEAAIKYRNDKAIDLNRIGSACKMRLNSSVFTYILNRHLSTDNQARMLDEIDQMLRSYTVVGFTGEGGGRDGIKDYFDGTGGFSGSGLQLLSFRTTYTGCRDALNAWLVDGEAPINYEL